MWSVNSGNTKWEMGCKFSAPCLVSLHGYFRFGCFHVCVHTKAQLIPPPFFFFSLSFFSFSAFVVLFILFCFWGTVSHLTWYSLIQLYWFSCELYLHHPTMHFSLYPDTFCVHKGCKSKLQHIIGCVSIINTYKLMFLITPSLLIRDILTWPHVSICKNKLKTISNVYFCLLFT